MHTPAWINARRLATPIAVSIVTIGLAQNAPAPPGRYAISGRVVDPHNLRSENAVLRLGKNEGESSAGAEFVAVAANGRFIARGLIPGTYTLELVQPAHLVASAKPVSFNAVRITDADVTGITVTVQRDFALTGRFKMESNNPSAAWPTHIAVSAYVALDGAGFLGSKIADGAPSGTFVLRNAFGPRVIKCGYSSAPGSHWWPSRVLMDGRDITNVPTDFSTHEAGRLEVVFTQHPARLAGTVRNPQGEFVPAPWIVVTSADRSLWQWWATTTTATQGNTKGTFSLPLLPGEYLVRAVPQSTFDSWDSALGQAQRYASEGMPVTVSPSGTSTTALTLQP
jgi:hypothetical protein